MTEMANGTGLPLGANLRTGGVTFRVWAPAAKSVNVRGNFNNWSDHALVREADGYWSASIDGVHEGDQYLYFVDGPGTVGYKRDPRARALTREPRFPDCNCIVTRPETFVWHDAGFVPPQFSDIVLYQLHVGAYWSTDIQGIDRRADRPGRFLDILFRVDHLVELGVNAVQLLPIQEFATMRSLGYNGVDYFSPEMDYSVAPTDPDFARYLAHVNALLARKGHDPHAPAALDCQTKQLMAVVDILHLHGIAVILDVVYNHAGGEFGDKSLYFLDRDVPGDNNLSLYFTNEGWAGGLVFAFWKKEVRQFLIDNACFFFDEYHVDGFRFDEVTVIDRFGGWSFLQQMTTTLQAHRPTAPLIAEYWADQSSVLRARADGGAGFDCVLAHDLRDTIRHVIAQAAGGAGKKVDLDPLANALRAAGANGYRKVQHLENHDLVRVNNQSDRQPRMPALADPSDSRSWYARSRTRLGTGLLLAAPGIPMLFMGQEIFEDKYWSDSPEFFSSSLIWWDGLSSDKSMQDFFRFTRELIALRRDLVAMRQGAINVFHVHNDNRVIAMHRWIEGIGEDIVLAANFGEGTHFGYHLGMPGAGRWRERFNSDTYEQWVNPACHGNVGQVDAAGPPKHGFQASAEVVIPANGFVLFSR